MTDWRSDQSLTYQRPHAGVLSGRLAEPRRWIGGLALDQGPFAQVMNSKPGHG